MSLAQRVSDLTVRVATEFKTVKTIITGNTAGTLTALTTTVKTSLLAAINEVKALADTKQNSLNFTPENIANKGSANGYASLDGGGKVPAAQLPAFVDDVLEFINLAAFPSTGTGGNLYVAIDTNIVYRWTGTAYVATNGALALGETSSTAYRGDRGAIAHTHALSSGNPHGTTFAQIQARPTTVAGYGLIDVFTKAEIGNIATNFVNEFNSAL